MSYSEVISMLTNIGIVLAILSVPVNVVGMCKYGWYDREPMILALMMVSIAGCCVIWWAIIPVIIAFIPFYLFSKAVVALCPNKKD